MSDQVHLGLSPDELATIVLALHAVELHGFADHLDTLTREVDQPPEA